MHPDMGAVVARDLDMGVVVRPVVRGCGLLLGDLSDVPVSSNDLLVCWHIVAHQGQNHHDHMLSYTDHIGPCMQLHVLMSHLSICITVHTGRLLTVAGLLAAAAL